MEETYKDIKGYNGIYQVSNKGNVRSKTRQVKGAYTLYVKKGRVLKQSLNSKGFLKVALHLNGKSETKLIHILVAESFLGHTRTGHGAKVRHLDFDKWNNDANNLKVSSNLDSIYTTKKGTSSKYIGVNFDKHSNKWKASLFYNKKQRTLGLFKTEIEAMNCYQSKLQELLNKS